MPARFLARLLKTDDPNIHPAEMKPSVVACVIRNGNNRGVGGRKCGNMMPEAIWCALYRYRGGQRQCTLSNVARRITFTFDSAKIAIIFRRSGSFADFFIISWEKNAEFEYLCICLDNTPRNFDRKKTIIDTINRLRLPCRELQRVDCVFFFHSPTANAGPQPQNRSLT